MTNLNVIGPKPEEDESVIIALLLSSGTTLLSNWLQLWGLADCCNSSCSYCKDKTVKLLINGIIYAY